MKNKLSTLIALMILVSLVSSCGTTTYRKRTYTSSKFIGHKLHWHNWHAHHYRPRAHNGGFW